MSDPQTRSAAPETGAATEAAEAQTAGDAQPSPGAEAPAASEGSIEEQVVAQLQSVFDPEIPVNIHELGLIYDVVVDEENHHVDIRMTLTSPMCPVAGELPLEVQKKAGTVPGVQSVSVDLVWDPPWNPSMMSEAAKLQLGFMD